MKISEQLKAGKALIENPANWLQGNYTNLDSEDADLQKATCFCSVGAAFKVMGAGNCLGPDSSIITSYLAKAVGLMTGVQVIVYNDSHTHPEVMAMWDKAIELAEAEGV